MALSTCGRRSLAFSVMSERRGILGRGSDRQLALGVVGLALAYAVELAAPAGWPRAAIAALGSLGFSLGAFGRAALAVRAAQRRERLPWLFIGAGIGAWLVGMLTRYAHLGSEVPIDSPSFADAAALAAAVLFACGFVAFLRGHRVAVYALLLDAASVILVMVAAIAFAVQDVFLTEMDADPVATTTVLLYTILYAAATACAFSALVAAPVDSPRRANVWLLVGIGLVAAAYTLALPAYLHGTYAAGTFLDALWMAGMLAISLAASSSLEDRGAHVSVRVASHTIRQFARMALPAGVAIVTASLIVVAENRNTEMIVIRTAAVLTILLAARAGVALYTNFRLGEVEGRRAGQFEALYEVGLAAAGERSFDDLLKLVVEQATSLSRTDGAMLALAEPDRRFTIRALHKGRIPDLRDSVGEPLAG